MKSVIVLFLFIPGVALAETTPPSSQTGLPDPAAISSACQKLQSDLSQLQTDLQAVIAAGGIVQPNSPGPQESPEGTIAIAGSGQIIDSQSDVWTVDSNTYILRNGQHAYDGWQTHKLDYHNHSVLQLGLDNNWWKWNGSLFVGPVSAP